MILPNPDAPPSLLELADATDVPRWPGLKAAAEGMNTIHTPSNVIRFPTPERPRTDLDAIMDKAFVRPACSHGQPLYRSRDYLAAHSELLTAAGVKRQFYHYMGRGQEPAEDWFATVVLIASRCRPFTSHEIH